MDRKYEEVNFWLTQVLLGHGSFGAFLGRIGKGQPMCVWCQETDMAEHVIMDCRRWQNERFVIFNKVGVLTSRRMVVKSLVKREMGYDEEIPNNDCQGKSR